MGLYNFFGTSMGLQRHFHVTSIGLSMVLPWDSHGTIVVSPWESHGTVMGLPQDSHGVCIVLRLFFDRYQYHSLPYNSGHPSVSSPNHAGVVAAIITFPPPTSGLKSQGLEKVYLCQSTFPTAGGPTRMNSTVLIVLHTLDRLIR